MSVPVTPPARPQAAISVRAATKYYPRYGRRLDRLALMLRPRRALADAFGALRGVSFDVPPGQTLGLIGPNGSGKSTLLGLIAGVLQPTAGAVVARGRTTALLELGAGFHPQFTGRENVALNGMLLGLSEAEVRARLPRIIDFAELGDFIDQPVKTYSSGMYVRLAFAVAISVDPDILVVDEALAVGDAYFQQRCLKRMREFRQQGKTIVFVSHDTALVKALCDRAILLAGGEIVADGPPDAVVTTYLQRFVLPRRPGAAAAGEASDAARAIPAGAGNETETILPQSGSRHGSGAARVLGIGVYAPDGRRNADLRVGEPLTVRLSVHFLGAVARPNIGFILHDRLGVDLAGTNTTVEGTVLPPAPPGAICTVQFAMALPPLHPGAYTITPTVADGDPHDYTICDWIEHAQTIQIGGPYHTGAVMHPRVTVTVLRAPSAPAPATPRAAEGRP